MGTFELIVMLVGGIAGSSVLTSYITTRSIRSKVKAEAEKVNADAADSVANSAKLLVETMRIDMKDMKAEIKFIRDENMILQKRVYELEAELKVYKTLTGAPVLAPTVPNIP